MFAITQIVKNEGVPVRHNHFLSKEELFNIDWVADHAKKPGFIRFSLSAHTPREHMLVADLASGAVVQVGLISIASGFEESASVADLAIVRWTPSGTSDQLYVPGGAIELVGDDKTPEVRTTTAPVPSLPNPAEPTAVTTRIAEPLAGVNFVKKTYPTAAYRELLQVEYAKQLAADVEPRLAFANAFGKLMEAITEEVGTVAGIEEDIMTSVVEIWTSVAERVGSELKDGQLQAKTWSYTEGEVANYKPVEYVANEIHQIVARRNHRGSVFIAEQADVNNLRRFNLFLDRFGARANVFGDFIRITYEDGTVDLLSPDVWAISRLGKDSMFTESSEQFAREYLALADVPTGGSTEAAEDEDDKSDEEQAYLNTLNLTLTADATDPKEALEHFASVYMSPEALWDDIIAASVAAKNAGAFTPGQMIEADGSEVLDAALEDEDSLIAKAAKQAQPVVDQIKDALGLKEGGGEDVDPNPIHELREKEAVELNNHGRQGILREYRVDGQEELSGGNAEKTIGDVIPEDLMDIHDRLRQEAEK